MQEPIDRALIEKYLNNQCSAEEEEMIHLWIDKNDADGYPSFLSEAKYQYKEKKIWKRLSTGLAGLHPQRSHQKTISFNFLFRWAAILLLLAAGIWATNDLTKGSLWWNGALYTTGYGEIRQINLQDGSVVMLNAMSVLKVPRKYGQTNRELYLTGEGYFKVQKDKHKPFIVYTKDIATRALGTQFNISAYPEDKLVMVSLQEGKVKIQKLKSGVARETVILLPGEEFSSQATGSAKRTFEEKKRLSWKEHTLYFKDDEIADVLGKLSRFYGVTFDYSALKEAKWKLNGEYKNMSLTEVMESLSFNYSFNYQILDNQVTLTP